MSKNYIADRADGSENSESKAKTSSVEVTLCKQIMDRMTPDMIAAPLDTYTALNACLDPNTITGQCSGDSSDSADF